MRRQVSSRSLLSAGFLALISILLPSPTQSQIPDEWQARVSAAQMLFSSSIPRDGLFPGIGNGFIAGDVGCSNITSPPASGGSCGRLHMGGVFNQQKGFPNRAVIPNPFSVLVAAGKKDGSGKAVNVGAALDLEYGMFYNRTRVDCVDAAANTADPVFVTIETATYAHQLHRQLLVLNITALDLPPHMTCTIHLTSCTSTTSDFTIVSASPAPPAPIVSLNMTVIEMEAPPPNGSVPAPPRTVVGTAYNPIPITLTFSTSSSFSFLGVFRSTLEPSIANTTNPSVVALSDLQSFSSPSSLSTLLSDHITAMQNKFWIGGIEIGGNSTIAATVNSSLFYIMSSIRDDWPYGTSPGGLTHNDYSGHSFWDTETWMFPVLALVAPNLAQSLLQYRFQRLPAAKDQAIAEGAKGAKWPWESALLGYGVSSWREADIYEIHITGDIPLAMQLLGRLNRNESWLATEVWPVASASADYFASRIHEVNVTQDIHAPRKPNRNAPETNVLDATLDDDEIATITTAVNYTLKRVVGADEKAGIQDDSAFTNAVAALTCRFALELANKFQHTPNPLWELISSRPYLPIAQLPNSTLLGHPEYTGYAGQDINQADVALLQYPLHVDMDLDIATNDLVYYQQRSSTVKTAGFFTGDSAYAIAWAQLGNLTAAEDQFLNAFAHMDMAHYNVWMETSFNGGGNLNFLTGAGGYLQNWIYGYARAKIDDSGIRFQKPTLPLLFHITSVKLRAIGFAGARFDMRYDAENMGFQKVDGTTDLVVIDEAGVRHVMTQASDGELVLPLQSVLVTLASSDDV